jgi:hypothetical protein
MKIPKGGNQNPYMEEKQTTDMCMFWNARQLAPREFVYYKANNISKIQIANSPHFYLVSSFFYLWMFTECKCWIKDVYQLAPLSFGQLFLPFNVHL